MIELLERAAAAAPSDLAVITPERSATYGELVADARRIAEALASSELTRMAIVERDAAWVIALLAGAALAGAEACQYQADIAPGEFAEQAAATGHTVVVTRRTDLTGPFTVIDPTALIGSAAASTEAPAIQPLLIRTTGTTGTPKAARHDWRFLARTVAGVQPRPDQRWLLAYGPHQFAGVQVLQHVVAAQATLVAPFPRQPRDGLDTLLEGGVTCVSATPTYWRVLLADAGSRGAALPPLEQITLGGEASPGDLLDDLRRAFPQARISHVYASTEFGSIASVRDGKPGFPVSAFYSETGNPESHLKIVDGELWVRATATDDADQWHATGDLVEIDGDRVAFSGRTSDVINVGGVKVHPLPIEERIAALPRVAMVRVYGRPNAVTGAIVAAEVVAADGIEDSDHDEIRADVRAAVADLPPAWHPRSIKFVDAIETLGAKTVRRLVSP
jgi:acyl-CoA synthetase (AMP-forming)/AMP-acid ligase II